MPRRESIPRIVDRVARLRHMDELLEKTSREATGNKHSTRSRRGKLAIKHYRLNSGIFLSVAILNRLERANSPGGNYELG